MDKKIPLLLDPPHILPPDLVLMQSVTINRKDDESPFKCERCGKPLDSSYYVLIGIPPSPFMIQCILCKNMDDEKINEKSVLSDIQSQTEDFDIESINQWIFSEDNMISSKMRICTDCYGEYEWPNWWKKGFESIFRIRLVYFAVEEYQRRHTPIDSSMTEYDKYLISLPDRSNVHFVGFGPITYGSWTDEALEHDVAGYLVRDIIKLVLISDREPSDLASLSTLDTKALLQEIRAEFIHDKDRIIPTEQELSACLKKHCNDNTWFNIKSCKIFSNPREFHFENGVDKTRYSVFVHCVNGDWEEFYI